MPVELRPAGDGVAVEERANSAAGGVHAQAPRSVGLESTRRVPLLPRR